MDIDELNREVVESARKIVYMAIEGETSTDELVRFALKYLKNGELVLYDKTKKLLKTILNAAIAKDFNKLAEVVR